MASRHERHDVLPPSPRNPSPAETGEVSTLTSIFLSQKEFSEARDEIEIAFRRFDYEPRHGRIILRIPSTTQEVFVQLIKSAIHDELARVASHDTKAGLFASQIVSAGSSRIFLDDNEDSDSDDRDVTLKNTRRQPDDQYQHNKAAFPGVVIEVSSSEDKKRLSKLAKQYIHFTCGNIKAVICIDINPGIHSTISVWRPRFTEERRTSTVTMDIEHVVQAEPFRSADGRSMNGERALTLTLHDFAPDVLCRNIPPISISLSFAQICEFMARAKRIHEVRESVDKKGIMSNRRVKRHRLSSSSIEELRSKNDDRFAKQEKKALDKAENHLTSILR
ncbi:hypothetical protein LCI18_002183 [Fusarium solani-melongenae]|uniref:Uncharacterized protein n=1 Tax=Fusarium solani subsp. cucurbitae TaxID=2747967 RepID=A0ACD3YTR1_FUSSC|nr:hypothetical protein LCI18_002183 [Fusarium solani-melongenae]